MMNFTEFNDFNELENIANELQTVDMDNIDDVEKALENIKKIRNKYDALIASNPFAGFFVEMFKSYLSIDTEETLEKCENELTKRYEELKEENNKSTKVVIDKSVEPTKHSFIRSVTSEDVEHALSNRVLENVNMSDKFQEQICDIIANYYNNAKTCPVVFDDKKEFNYVTNILFSFADYVLNK